MIAIDGLSRLLEALSRIDLAPRQQEALAAAGERLAESVKDVLSRPPDSEHSTPWPETGTLRDSIVSEADADEAIVASTDPVAAYQEIGTHKISPRPFLAPTAAAQGEGAARSVAETIVNVLRENLR